MGDINLYFSYSEFECPCCKKTVYCSELINVLTDLRVYFGRPVKVNSGYRCKSHNKKVGGAPKSKHVSGIAADIVVKNVKAADVYEYLDKKYPDKYGIGKYKTWTHIDTRSERARW